MATITESVYATRKTRKGAEALVARDGAWLAKGSDFRLPEGTPSAAMLTTAYVRFQVTSLEVRKADDGTFQVVRVVRPL